MSKRWKLKTRGELGFSESPAVEDTPIVNDPAMNAAWLSQFTPMDEAELTESQKSVLAEMRKQFPTVKVGRRDTRISYYTIDPQIGPFAGDL